MEKDALIIKQKISETLESNYMPYAMSVIVSRALPEIDGFKPSHRKLLYTMYKMGLLKGARTKSANIVGQTMKLNPHGDAAIYETMVRLTKGNASLHLPLIDSKGNFGKVYSRDMAYAASRYTEAKLEGVCEELFKDIEENAVSFVDNYDGKMKEPVMFPVTFPHILANPNQGIAVGMASNICSFNLEELCDATIAYLKTDSGEIEIQEYLRAPDFPTGGALLYDEKEMQAILETGRGSFKLRATYFYNKKDHCIEITEIPYTTTVEAIIDKIEDLVKTSKIREISDVRDETDLSGLRVTIDLKRGTDPEILMAKLFKKTPLEDSFSCNFNILIDGNPRVMGVKEILKEWCEFRKRCIINKYLYSIDKMQKRHHLLMGLKRILLDIDEAIEIIRHTEKESEVVPNLMKAFEITELQANFIAEIKLRHLNKQYILNTVKEADELEKEITRLQGIIQEEKKLKKVIIAELLNTKKKYGSPRKTKLIEKDAVKVAPTETFIEDYKVKVFFTKDQYLKKISLVSLRSSGEQKLKEEDEIIQELEEGNKSEILFFSDACNVYKMKLYEIEDTKASQLGVYVPNILGLAPDEKVISIHLTRDYEGYFCFGFENGKVSKVAVKSYETKTNRKKLVKAYANQSKCIGIAHVEEEDALKLIRSDKKGAVLPVKLLSEKQKRDAQGVQAITLIKNTKMVQLMKQDHSTGIVGEGIKKLPTSCKTLG